jgi:peptidoglycan/xylan/chitin deacetylase (PgdA/CDA1 family)
MRHLLVFALAVGFALAAGACDGEDDGSASPSPAPTSTQTQSAPTSAATETAVVTFTAVPATSTIGPSTATPVPQSAIVVRTGVASRRSVALTFDAGADPGHTAGILAVLRAEGVRASFGVTGRWAQENAVLLQAIAADGHQFINHSYSHDSFTGFSTGGEPMTFEGRSLELSRTETTVFRLTNRSTRPWFRPPYGDLDASVEADVAALGYPYIAMWSIDTFGWRRATADEIVERTLSLAAPGAVIVMHVGIESQDAAALPRVIEGLRAQGYGFETMDEIIVQ